MLPNIIILDLDGTIIGDSTSVDYFAIFDGYSKLCKLNNLTIDKRRFDLESTRLLNEALSSGLLRPGFLEFMTAISNIKPIPLVYVFSSGKKRYVDMFIKHIENLINVKFCRPLFTRELSSAYGLKSISEVFDVIYEDLCKTPSIKKLVSSKKTELFENHVLFIDDRDDHILDKNASNIVCPRYTFTYPCDMFDRLVPFEHKKMFFESIKLVKDTYIWDYSDIEYGSHLEFLHSKVSILMSEIERTMVGNKKQLNDKFWSRMAMWVPKYCVTSKPQTRAKKLKQLQELVKTGHKEDMSKTCSCECSKQL